MNRTAWIVFSIATIGILATLVAISNNQSLNVGSVNTNQVQPANAQNGNIADHTRGKADSKVTIIEYGDYECPGCGEINPTVEALYKAYGDRVRFVFRNYPLTSAHPGAMPAAGAAEAAGLQGKFWEMHNKIYSSQSDWNTLSGDDLINKFIGYAKELGLDMSKFKTDTASDAVNKKIAYDRALGVKAGIEATPSFYLNGNLLTSATWSNKTKFAAAIEADLK